MDPFLPGEIPVMVLRYLAANQCVGAAMKLIEEMPRLKEFIPAKPAHVSEAVYLKHLLRSSENPGLKDMLWDYKNSKILVQEVLDTEENMFSTESLLKKVKKLQEIVKTSGKPFCSTRKTPSPQRNEVTAIPKTDAFTSTEDYECPKCLDSRSAVTQKTDFGCQTEEITAVQFGLQDEIPIIFYETLLSDNNLQQKIAQTINEHMQDPQGERNEKISKISSKAETEIDKFLVDLLQDMPDDNSNQSSTGLLQHLGGAASVADIERNLSSLFGVGDEDIAVGNSNSDDGPVPHGCADDPPKLPASDSQIDLGTSSGQAQNITPRSSITHSPSKSCETKEPDFEEGPRGLSSFLTPPGSTVSPKRSQRIQSIKRITPTPLTTAPVNPVFNTSVIVEKKTVEMGQSSAQLSVIKANVATPMWKQLNRRSIDPKIPSACPKITSNVTILNRKGENTVFQFDKEEDRALVAAPSSSKIRKPLKTPASEPSLAKDQIKINPASAHKRKTTPVKLTPEKARNIEYNFMHFHHESSKKSKQITESAEDFQKENTENKVDSSAKKTPLMSSIAQNQKEILPDSTNKPLVLSGENSQHDMTPMQPPPAHDTHSNSTLKTISPNALQRLVASANKALATNPPAAYFRNKKSFSTPRKRKHVRSLSFETPPSLKGATSSEPLDKRSDWTQGLKRKATQEPSVEPRSKKRLNWPESEKKNAAVASSICTRRSSETVVTSSTTENQPLKSLENQSQFESIPSTKYVTSDNAQEPAITATKPTMPTILEESMNNISTAIATANDQGFEATQAPKQLTIVTIPVPLSDGTTKMSYFQLTDDMKTLIPLTVLPISDNCVAEAENQEPVSSIFNTYGTANPLNLQEQASVVTPVEANSLDDMTATQPPVPPTASASGSLTFHQDTSAPQPSLGTLQSTTTKTILPSLQDLQSHGHSNPDLPASSPASASPAHISPNSSLVTVIPLKNSANANCTSSPDNSPSENRSQKSTRRSSRQSKSTSKHSICDETTITQTRSKRNSKKELEPQFISLPEPLASSSPNETQSGKGRTRQSSRSNANEKKQVVVDESVKKDRLLHAVPCKPSYLSPEYQNAMRKATDEQEKCSKRSRSKGKQNEKLKRPKITLSVKDLFGDSPLKQRTDKKKLPTDVIAAQAVASQAVPLGSHRKSPRKQPLEVNSPVKAPLQKVLPIVHVLSSDTGDNENSKAEASKPEPSAVFQPDQLPPAQTTETAQQQQAENVFNIVPAPLGFPEPTPMKNFSAAGCLNISDITCNTGPLITPFKSGGHPGLNETHFTLPPTPRVMMEDNDSNSNSNQSLKMIFDGLYPSNLLTSTPLKHGIPRTPGRESSSSNSVSPIQQPVKTIGVVQSVCRNPVSLSQQQPPVPVQIQTQAIVHPMPASTPSASTSVSVPTSTIGTMVDASITAPALNLSSPSANEKSDGEISSSDDEDNAKEPKCLVANTETQKPPQSENKSEAVVSHCSTAERSKSQVSSFSSKSSSHQQQRHQSRPILRPPTFIARPPQSQPNPFPSQSDRTSASSNSNLRQTHGICEISFNVGGREKLLSMSEKETLYSLVTMEAMVKENESRKQNASKPVLIKPSQPQPVVASAPQKPANVEVAVKNFVKNNPLDRLLSAVRKVKPTKNN